MSKHRNREEAVNTQLALFISKLGVTADAETIHVHGKHRPDVLFQLRGLRVVIEGKFKDTPNADAVVFGDARKRVKAGIAHIAVAAVYPDELRSAPTTKIMDVLAGTKLRYRIVTETFESENWFEGSPSALMESLRRAQESLTQDDIVEKTAKALSVHLEGIAKLWIGQPGACDRLSKLLGIGIPKKEEAKAALERRETAAKVSALVLANAFIFQEQLSLTDERVETLRKLKKESALVDATSKHWRWIWENINYVPIFQLGERILDELPASTATTEIVKSLLDEAHKICAEQAALRHDLMGRIYHWLLHHAKYLGTYYTSVSAATLLLKVTLDLEWKTDFGGARELADFKVADLACGTGTLLMAAAQALTDAYIKTRAETDRSIEAKDLSVLHSTLMQNVIHGYDILPSAVHLTASTLALLAPEVAFRQMNLFVMPIGVDHGTPRLGSIDFLDGDQLQTQFALDSTHLDAVQTGASKSAYANAKVPKLDLCVMNPPFVSSRYGNRLFGSIPEDRPKLQKELSRQAKKLGISATAGLGALFVPLADKHLKSGGRIAFVLPIALASGESWGAVRKYLADRYHLELVITSHDPARTNFSENTDLSELLFVARKLKSGERADETRYVTLKRNPTTIHEALDTASRISVALKELDGTRKAAAIKGTGRILGEVTSLPAPEGTENWTSAIFSQSYLAQVHWHLAKDRALVLPGTTKKRPLPLCRLDELGGLGYDVRDITDAFEVDRTATQWTPYSGFWDHDAEKVVQIAQKPNAFLTARTKAIEGRNLKSATAVWDRAGSILLVSRLRTNTHKVIATGFEQPVLGNTWWAFKDTGLTTDQRKALLLWLNSGLGLLLYFGRRAITQGAWMQMKKPAWEGMQVLDVRSLTPPALAKLAAAYDEFSGKTLRPLSKLDTDPVRLRIDDALCAVLDLPSLTSIRDLMVREPGLTGRDFDPSKPDDVTDDDEDEVEGSVEI
ncbi:N-6 DNA methylase [Agrobacterium pusense]|uniref:site-specific DNA-methyltransferase (adenine-specific) n=1 Tax=Agrobacterium pusense TaxID=648995 RepID=A0AA44ENS0_9HYPH|nr:N-6 DNA methylase [Agrobacterium pusense]NRF10805.1 N-6 DNA methylase [Agrobacterium pusense]NRF21515.1 N-6 DNA methylase [Agrobacterium pusense]